MPKRSLNQIQQEIVSAKEQYVALNALDSNSPLSIWRLWTYVIAAVLWLQELAWEGYKEEMETLKPQHYPGTLAWYADQLKQFQEGDALVLADGALVYPEVDESKRIIAFVSATDHGDGSATLHVQKENQGKFQLLSASELAQAETFLHQVQHLGADLSLDSLDADRLRADISITAAPFFELSEVQSETEAFIKAYCLGLAPKSTFDLSDFEAQLNQQEMVESATVNSLTIVDHLDNAVAVSGTHDLVSGFLYPDETTGQTMNDLIDYSYA